MNLIMYPTIKNYKEFFKWSNPLWRIIVMLVSFIAGFSLVSCSSTKNLTQDVKVETVYVKVTETVTEKVIDTVRIVELPIENSFNIDFDTVYAETSLAWGYAYLFDNMNDNFLVGLKIQNKPEAKLPYRKEYVYINKSDTLFVTDSIFHEAVKVIDKKENKFNSYIVVCGWLLNILVVFYVLYKIFLEPRLVK